MVGAEEDSNHGEVTIQINLTRADTDVEGAAVTGDEFIYSLAICFI